MKLFKKLRNTVFSKPIDIFSCFKPYFLFFRLYGTFPYSFTPENELKVLHFEKWLGIIVYYCMCIFLLTTWIIKLDVNELVKNPFLLLSFIRSLAYFGYVFLYNSKMKFNHESNIKIFRKIKKINYMVSIDEKALKNFFIYNTVTIVMAVTIFPIVMYFFLADAKNLQRFFNNLSMIMTLSLSNSTENHVENLCTVVMMYLDETMKEIKKLSSNFSKTRQLKFV